MSNNRKLTLVVICIGILLIVLTVNVVRRIQEDNPESKTVTIKENVITSVEAYRLLSYLEYNKAEREALSKDIQYSDEQMTGENDTYINAVYHMGLINSKVTDNPQKAMTYGDCKELIDKLILANPQYQTAYKGLSFEFTKADEEMLIKDFLELYQSLLNVIPEKDRKIKKATLLVLGRENSEDGMGRMITDQGKYFYQDAKCYDKYLAEDTANLKSKEGSLPTPSGVPGVTQVSKTTAMPLPNKSDSNISSITPTGAASDQGLSEGKTDLVDQYMDKGINVMVCDQEIVYITSVSTEKIVLHNVWIKEGHDNKVDTFLNDIDKSFSAVSKLKTPLEKVIGDLTIENQRIVKINVKPDMIQGKVLRSGDDFIEISGYGKVPLDENFKIYKIYGELSVEPSGSILVGYENTDFVVSNGKISAALITESIKAQNIRVLLNTTGYQGVYHDKVEFTASSDFTVSAKKKDYKYHKGDKVTLEPGDGIFKEGRVTVKADSENAKIQILSIKRSYGNPKYRGTLEIADEDKGLILVNELPLEEYLCAVIPSEMPTSFGVEALKVQAVCARSYAYKHLIANSLSTYGAHVDDSAAYQVYNNVAENEESILAVKDTYGQVIKYNDEVITAFYYSTSCGHSAEPSNVWANNVSVPYLKSKLLLVNDNNTVQAQSIQDNKYEDLSSEKAFKKFVRAKDIKAYDSSFSWYRWKVTISVNDIKRVIDSNLLSRYQNSPDLILTKKDKGSEYESVPIDTIGDIKDIKVLKRESSGNVSELLIVGSKHTIKVIKDINIRAVLSPRYDSIIRQDDSEIEGMTLLPSSFFMIEKKKKKGKLNSIKLTGGGFGHGVGMSQNAVKTFVDSGKDYKAIVSYFYEGTQMGSIYD